MYMCVCKGCDLGSDHSIKAATSMFSYSFMSQRGYPCLHVQQICAQKSPCGHYDLLEACPYIPNAYTNRSKQWSVMFHRLAFAYSQQNTIGTRTHIGETGAYVTACVHFVMGCNPSQLFATWIPQNPVAYRRTPGRLIAQSPCDYSPYFFPLLLI